MGKKKKSSGQREGFRTRVNPLTGDTETVAGTRSGKKRARLPEGHPLRTHDRKPAGSKKKRHDALMNRDKSKD